MTTNTQNTKSIHLTFTLEEYEELKKSYPTKSAMIKYLDSMGVKRGRIADELSIVYGKNMRYQHVRNVLTHETKRVIAE